MGEATESPHRVSGHRWPLFRDEIQTNTPHEQETMKLQHLLEYFENEFQFPVDHATVLNQIGGVTVDAPDDSDSETIDEILASDNDKIYETSDDLFESVIGDVDDSYIGRKYYDDRGPNITDGIDESPRDDRNQSF